MSPQVARQHQLQTLAKHQHACVSMLSPTAQQVVSLRTGSHPLSGPQTAHRLHMGTKRESGIEKSALGTLQSDARFGGCQNATGVFVVAPQNQLVSLSPALVPTSQVAAVTVAATATGPAAQPLQAISRVKAASVRNPAQPSNPVEQIGSVLHDATIKLANNPPLLALVLGGIALLMVLAALSAIGRRLAMRGQPVPAGAGAGSVVAAGAAGAAGAAAGVGAGGNGGSEGHAAASGFAGGGDGAGEPSHGWMGPVAATAVGASAVAGTHEHGVADEPGAPVAEPPAREEDAVTDEWEVPSDAMTPVESAAPAESALPAEPAAESVAPAEPSAAPESEAPLAPGVPVMPTHTEVTSQPQPEPAHWLPEDAAGGGAASSEGPVHGPPASSEASVAPGAGLPADQPWLRRHRSQIALALTVAGGAARVFVRSRRRR